MENIVQSGIVVVSPQNNPSLITPQFLVEYEITPRDWEVKSVFESPQVTRVIFQNGYTISSESGKIVFQYDLMDDGPKPFSEECKISEMVKRYLNQICKVKYTNIGVNYVLITDECKNSFENLFSSKIIELTDMAPQQLNFQQPFSEIAVQNLIITPSTYEHNKKDMYPCLEFKGNLHFDIKETSIENSGKKTQEIINSWPSYFEPFSNMVNKFKDILND